MNDSVRRRTRFTSTFLSAAGLCLLASAANAQSLSGLGFFLDGSHSEALAVSPEGSVVVGWGDTPSGNHAFRWTPAGMQDLGTLPGGTQSYAYDASSNGAVVVGYSDSPDGLRGFRWSDAEGMQSLGTFPGAPQSYAYGVSDDGSVIVGGSGTPTGMNAYRWTIVTGLVNLGTLSVGNYFSMAYGVSSDGSIVAGMSDSSFGDRGFRWTSADGMQNLGWQVGWPTQEWAISGDGTTVVGYGGSVTGSVANRWTAASGIVAMGVLPGNVYSYSYAASADGSMIVGASGYGNPGNYTATLWTQSLGMVDLNQYLTNAGVNLDGWILQVAQDISSDGMTIVGSGFHNGYTEAWVASLRPRCGSADFDCDGDTGTDQDIEAFFSCLAGNCPSAPCGSTADFDGDGDVGTDQDIEAFFRVLAGGSC